ncbi:MAG: SusC/RagA family TonB-linked outer membrane protein, partial [Bacteroidales bacterium]|nr:SusC/RagA family TonB-linked outer membrane protein [Bacteroidales bacterium]
MNKRYIPLLIAFLFLGISGKAFGQIKEKQSKGVTSVTVTSIVKDDSGRPVPKVLVSGKEGAIEVMTDAEGHFTIKVPEKTDLLFEAEGYETKNVPVYDAMDGAITIKKADFLMEDANMVNIAFGKVRKKEVIAAVSVIDPKKMKKTDGTEYFYDALTAKVPGLLGNNNLRGLGSALIVVDGIPRDPSNLNLSEIDQISVLKDGNASMLWGSQAQNGVIQITTKRGTAFKRKVEVSVEQGFSKPVALPKYLGSAEYFTLYNEARVNDGLTASRSESTIALYADSSNHYRYPNVDYYSSEYLKELRPTTSVLTQFSGGNATTQYYANVGWNRKGTLYNLGKAADMSSNRFNMRANVNFKVNEYIKSSVDAVIVFDMNKNPNGNFWSDASTLHPDYYSPLLPISAVKNTPGLAAQLGTAKQINNGYILGGTAQYASNPYGNMFLSGNVTNNQRNASINNSIEFDLRNITPGLKFRTYLSFDVYNRYNVQVTNQYAVYTPTWDSSDSISALTMVGTDATSGVQNMPVSSMYFERRIGTYAMFDYAKTIGKDHTIAATLLGYWDKFRQDAVLIDQKDAHLGLRVTYDYKKKYFADFSSTYTNGFRLMPGKRGGYAPSLALAWILSEEDFMKDSKQVDYLKLRGSASIQNLDLNNLGTEWRPYEESFMMSGSYYNYADGTRQTQGVTIMRSANPNLTFEKMKSVNLGIEGSFFNRLLSVDANVFTQRWTGQVVRQSSTYSSFLGSYYPYENYNETGYYGGELGLTLAKSIGKFSFQLGSNLLYATSKVLKKSELWGNDYQYRQGKSVDGIYGLEALGLFQDVTEIANSPVQKYSEAKPGDIKYKDQNDDHMIDANDQVRIGNSQARFSYGLNLLLKYGNLSLMATGDGRSGYQYLQRGEY